MKIAEKSLVYLYCVTQKPPEPKEVENLADKLYFVYTQGLYAVVSRVCPGEFSKENLKKNLADLEWVKVRVSLHEKVVEEIMKNACVIPFKFATLFNSEDSLKLSLEKNAQVFRENFKKLEGKEEWGVKIYCDLEKLKISLMGQEFLEIDKQISSASAGKAFFLKKKKEELLDKAVNKNINQYGQVSFDRLKEESIETRINKLLPKEVTEREDDMILNSAFLVDKSRVGEFAQIADSLKTKYNDNGLNFDFTGP